jgi:hypothetical protein
VGVREGATCLGYPESKRRGRFTAAASMVTATDSWALGRMQGKSRGVYRTSNASSEDYVWFEDRWMVASWCD